MKQIKECKDNVTLFGMSSNQHPYPQTEMNMKFLGLSFTEPPSV